jgi:hypothetical protein
MKTSEHYSPFDLLPAPEPKTVSPDIDYFYQNTVKHLVKDTVRIMNNGINIDLTKVVDLEEELARILANVETTLANNTHIKAYLEHRYKSQIAKYRQEQRSKLKQASHFLKDFDPSKQDHRSYFMHIYATQQSIPEPSELLPTGIPKWPANTVKKLAKTNPFLAKLINKQLPSTHPIAKEAMQLFAQHKADIYNKSYQEKIHTPTIPYPVFSAASPQQKQELFSLLNLQSEKTSKTTGSPSWDRSQVERVNKETTDPDLRELTQALIDHSFAAIVKNNFIEAFYKYTVDSRLYGQYKLFGAKSFRYTSSNPNMLNMPSTGSIFAKPIKRCFTAPPGKLVYAIDLSALEDRVIASLSRDTNKCSVFTDGLDGHCLNALGYFREEVAQHMPLTGDTVTDVKKFFDLQEHGHKDLKDIRQRGKPATFGLSYGAFPPKVANTLKIPISEAEQIFDRYHNVLYSGITDYRENYVLPTAEADGKVHLGLGCYISSDNPSKDIRTLNNATCQFWSIITILTISKIHQLIDDNGYQDRITCVSTIYDSIYYEIDNDPALIKWLNDAIVPIITQDFMENQTIHNEAAGEIGYDWADLHLVPNNASLSEITSILENLDD